MRVQDWLGEKNDIGIDIFENKYRNEDETFDEWLDRVSGGNKEIRQLIVDKKFLFGGRILANRGIAGNKTYSNCYVLSPPEDNLESIFNTAKKLARTFSYGGGVGFDLGKLAPKGAKVNNTAKYSTGAVSFTELYNTTTGLIGQNGRRGALMLSMPVNHPDIEEFIELKGDVNKITNANISVRVDDEFMTSVLHDTDYKLSFTRKETGEVIEKNVSAKRLFRKLCEMNWKCAEPGILFWDEIQGHNMMGKDSTFTLAGVNPCVTGDTLIQTTKGEIQIKDLVGTTPDVYCMDENGKVSIRTASKVWKTRDNAQLVAVFTRRGVLRCTPDHKIHTRNRGWVEACELKRGDKITGLNRMMKDERHIAVGLSGSKYIPEHRLVASYYYDIVDKDVHHLDNDTLNNSIENLQVIDHKEHSRITNTDRHIEVIRDEKGRYVAKEHKKKRDSFNLGCGTGTNWTVREVVWLKDREDVYDMTVPEVHNFIANRMVVHNCAEEPLPAGGSCLLGAINLSEFVVNPFTDSAHFDSESFTEAVKTAVVALNEVLDEGLMLHPLAEQRIAVKKWRQIGLGIMGLADCLIKLGLVYGSEEANHFCKGLALIMFRTALVASDELGGKIGTYEGYDPNVVNESDLVKRCGVVTTHLANSQLLTVAPTGTISTMLGVSGGIEPMFATKYTRKTQSLHGEDVTYEINTPIVQQYLTLDSVDHITALPPEFITAREIKPINRLKCQAAWQSFIDASISSTINLPNSATVEDIERIYIDAWSLNLKGVTVYREGCDRESILTTDHKEEVVESTKTNGLERHLTTGCGSLHVCAFFDDKGNLKNTYLSKGSTGGCNNYMIGLSRMISLAARNGVSIDDIVDQLDSCGVCPSYAVRKATKGDVSAGACCPIAVGKALKDMKNEVTKVTVKNTPTKTSILCPKCNEPLVQEGGCIICKNCGWSKCD